MGNSHEIMIRQDINEKPRYVYSVLHILSYYKNEKSK